MNTLQSARELHDITPENILGDMQAEGTGIARWMCKVSLREGFREGVIVGDKDQGAVAEPGICKCQMNSDYIAVPYFLPIRLHVPDGFLVRFVGQVIAC